MSNRTNKEDAPVTFDVIYASALANAKSEHMLANTIKRAPSALDAEEIKRAVYAARVSLALGASKEKALLVLSLKTHKKDVSPTPDDMRTAEQEKAYGAARVWFTAFKQRHGLETKGRRENPEGDKSKLMDTEKLVSPKFKVSTSLELAAFCQAHAAQGYSFFLLNKAHPAVSSEVGAKLMGAYADLVATIKEITGDTPK